MQTSTYPIKSIKNGIIKINDNAILFDNQFYFTLSEPSNIKVLSINDKIDSSVSKSLFNAPIFNYESVEQKISIWI